jgi:hypothetical protein
MKNLIKNNITLFTIIATIQLPITILIMKVLYDASLDTGGGDAGFTLGILGVSLTFGFGIISLMLYITILIEIKKNTNIKHIIIPLLPIIISILAIVIGLINGFITDTQLRKAYTTDVFVNEVLTDFDNIDKTKTASYVDMDNNTYILNLKYYFEDNIDAYYKLEKNGIWRTQEQNEYIEVLIPKVMEKIKDKKVYYKHEITKIKDWELVKDTSTRRYTIKITYTNFRTEIYEID